MIYITGDLHGDRNRFQSPQLKKLKKGDTLIVCGDFGFIWQGGKAEEKILSWIGKRKYNVLFVEGTHDNLELLGQYPTQEWQGGLTHHISGRLRHLCRGEIFNIEGKTVLAMGGGQPDENSLPGVSFWPGVLPSKEEVLAICDRLDDHQWKADVVVSHQAPTYIDACITQQVCEVNMLTALMDTVRRKNGFGLWCFGSYHLNKLIPPNFRCLYTDVYCIGGIKHGIFGGRPDRGQKDQPPEAQGNSGTASGPEGQSSL